MFYYSSGIFVSQKYLTSKGYLREVDSFLTTTLTIILTEILPLRIIDHTLTKHQTYIVSEPVSHLPLKGRPKTSSPVN